MRGKEALPIVKCRRIKVSSNVLHSGLWRKRYYRLKRDHNSLIRDLYHKFSGIIKRKRGIVQISFGNPIYLELLQDQFVKEDIMLSEIATKYNRIKIRRKKEIFLHL